MATPLVREIQVSIRDLDVTPQIPIERILVERLRASGVVLEDTAWTDYPEGLSPQERDNLWRGMFTKVGVMAWRSWREPGIGATFYKFFIENFPSR